MLPIIEWLSLRRDVFELLTAVKEKTVLILGRDYGESLAVLTEIKSQVERAGYRGILLKEQSDYAPDSLLRKLLSLALMARFVIIEDSQPSGHLFELQYVKSSECITCLLRRKGTASTRMFDDAAGKYDFIKEFSYHSGELPAVLNAAMEWAEDKVLAFSEHHLSVWDYK